MSESENISNEPEPKKKGNGAAIEGRKQLPVPSQQAWEALHDTRLLSELIDGCSSLEWVSGTTINGVVTTKVGPVKAKFAIELQVSESVPFQSYRMSGGANAKGLGFASGHADISFVDTEDGCEIHYRAQVNTGGKIAQLGSRLMKGVSRKFVDGFFERLVASLNVDDRDSNPVRGC